MAIEHEPEIIHGYSSYEGDRSERLDHALRALNHSRDMHHLYPNRYLCLTSHMPDCRNYDPRFNPTQLIKGIEKICFALYLDLSTKQVQDVDLDSGEPTGKTVEVFNPWGHDLAVDIVKANKQHS